MIFFWLGLFEFSYKTSMIYVEVYVRILFIACLSKPIIGQLLMVLWGGKVRDGILAANIEEMLCLDFQFYIVVWASVLFSFWVGEGEGGGGWGMVVEGSR